MVAQRIGERMALKLEADLDYVQGSDAESMARLAALFELCI